jgi:hypothetical protein
VTIRQLVVYFLSWIAVASLESRIVWAQAPTSSPPSSPLTTPSPVPPEHPTEAEEELERSLSGWRYKPYVDEAGQPSPACFALTFRLVFERR